MEMDRACIADGTVQTPEDCTDLEASRKAKTRKAKRDMEEDDREGKTTARTNILERGEDGRSREERMA